MIKSKIKILKLISKKIHIIFVAFLLVFIISGLLSRIGKKPAPTQKPLTFSRQLIGPYQYKGDVKGVLTASFGKDKNEGKVEVERNGSKLSFSIPLANLSLSSDKDFFNPEAVSFTSADKIIEAKYNLVANGLKEEIILNKIPQENKLPIKLKTENLTLKITPDGIPVFYSASPVIPSARLPARQEVEGSYQFHFERPFMKDGAGNVSYGVKYLFGSEKKPIGKTEKKLLASSSIINNPSSLIIELDADWLHDPKRVLPIVIDPTVVHDTTAEFATGQLNRVTDTGSGSSPILETYYQELPADEYTIALWHMNESADNSCSGGQDICDASGNGHHGTFAGNAAFSATAKLGAKSIDLDGTDDYVDISNSSEYGGLSEFTISAWINTDTIAAGEGRILDRGSSGSPNTILFTRNAGSLLLYVNNTGLVTASNVLTASQWYHVAATFKGGKEAIIYINGEERARGTTTISAPTAGSITTWIGDVPWTTGDYEFAGLIDEFHFDNIARTPEEIKLAASRRPYSVYISDVIDLTSVTSWNSLSWTELGVATGDGETLKDSTNLVAQWNFNETSGTNANNDAEGTSCGGTPANCDGTLSGFDSTASQDADPDSSWTANNRRWGAGALQFDGTDSYVSAGDPTALTFGTSNFSVESWVKFNTVGTTYKSIAGYVQTSGAGDFWGIEHSYGNDEKIRFWYSTDAQSTLRSAVSPTKTEAGKWYHIVGVRDGTTVRLYINGQQVSTGAGDAGVLDSDGAGISTAIGRSGGYAGLYFNGTIDSTRIYSRALTAAEILSNYNSSNIELQTRVGADSSPDDGSWEAWAPTTSETQIDNFDSNQPSDGVFEMSISDFATNQNWQKINNANESASDTTGTSGRIPLGTNGKGDDAHIYGISVIKDGSTYKMWYTGHDGATLRLYLATSSDGLTWTKQDNTVPANSDTTSTNGRIPLGTNGTGDDTHASYPTVIKDGSTYKMWYSGDDGTNRSIYYATSSDGLTWTKLSNTTASNCDTACEGNGKLGLGSSGRGDDVSIFAPSVIKDGSTYKMWYSGNDGSSPRLYYATSSDGLTWTKLSNTTASNCDTACEGGGKLGLGSSGRGDDGAAYVPTVIKDGNIYKLWYSGYDGVSTYYIFYAASHDGLTWIKQDNTVPSASNKSGTNGRVPLGASGTGDDAQTFSQAVLKDTDGNYKIWYAGYDGANYRVFGANMAPLPYTQTTDTVILQEGSGAEKFVVGQPQINANTLSFYHLNETNGDNAGVDIFDATNNSFDLEIAGGGLATGVVNGISNKARSFNGTNDIASCTDASCGGAAGFDTGSSDLTVSAWVKTTSAAIGGVASKMNSGGVDGWALGVEAAGTAKLWAYGGTSFGRRSSVATVNDGKWHHIVGVYNAAGATITMYVDGAVSQGTLTGTVPTSIDDSADDFSLGFGQAGIGYFNGSIDEVRIDKIARTAEEIAEEYRAGRDHYLNKTISSTDLSAKKSLPFYVAADRPGTYLETTIGESAYANNQPDVNTVGLWHLAEQSGSGAYIKDSSGNGNNGTPTGTTFVQGKIGKGRSFNGTSDYINVTDHSSLQVTNGTLSAWVYLNSHKNYNVIIDKYNFSTARSGYSLYLGSGGIPSVQIGNASTFNTVASNVSISTGQWYYLVTTFDGSNLKIYVNGVLTGTASQSITPTYTTDALQIGASTDFAGTYVNGLIDETRVDNTARTADQIRQAYEVGKRTHPITIDFAAKLDSGNLITGSGDLSFTVDATYYGLQNKGDKLFAGDKVIVRETVNDTEYIAQGTVTAVTSSTGATTIAAWDSGSTFPSGGYTANASIFKWQREYFDISNLTLDSFMDGITQLTLRVTDGNEGRTVWLDDLKSAGDFLTTPGGSTITSSTGNQYFQYRVIEHSADEAISASLTAVTLDYTSNFAPNTPSLDAPTDTATNQLLSPLLKTTATDADSDYLRYKIELCTNVGMTTGCQTFDQTSSQTGWSGQNTQTNTAYTSGTQATYTIQTPLTASTTYYWRSYAIDPGGTNAWSSTQGTPYSFTTTTPPSAPTTPYTEGQTNPTGITDSTPEFSAIHNDTDTDAATYYEIEVNTASGFTGTVMWDSGQTSMATTANGARSPDISYAGSSLSWGTIYYWRIRFTDNKGAVGAWSATQNFTLNNSPNTPTLDSPTNGVIDQPLLAVLKTTATDNDSDYLRYKIELCTNAGMTTGCQTFDQTSSQTGWSGQNTQTSTAYTSGTQATYTIQAALNINSTYYWRSYAKDPAGSNAWSSTQGTPYSFTTVNIVSPSSPTSLLTNGATNPTGVTVSTLPYFSAIHNDSDNQSANYYQIQVSNQPDVNGTIFWDSGQTSMTSTANGVRSPNITYGGSTLALNGQKLYWRIRFWDISGNAGAWSNPASFTLLNFLPSQSCKLQKNPSNTQIIVSWIDQNSGEDGYYIEKNTDGAGFTNLTTRPANSTSYTDSAVSSGHTYGYRVRATTGSDYSDWCSTATLNLATGSFQMEGLQFEGIQLY